MNTIAEFKQKMIDNIEHQFQLSFATEDIKLIEKFIIQEITNYYERKGALYLPFAFDEVQEEVIKRLGIEEEQENE